MAKINRQDKPLCPICYSVGKNITMSYLLGSTDLAGPGATWHCPDCGRMYNVDYCGSVGRIVHEPKDAE